MATYLFVHLGFQWGLKLPKPKMNNKKLGVESNIQKLAEYQAALLGTSLV